MNKKSIYLIFLLISLIYSYFHISYHNSVHQTSVKTEQQQEESLFSEGAFYYSFYKDITTSNNTISALYRYIDNPNYEAPSSINPHKRFNLSYEAFAGLSYRALNFLGLTSSPIKFYNYLAYIINGFSLLFILLITHLLTQNFLFSLLAGVLYFTNFEHLTRMVTNTPLRENIGITFLLAHIYATLLFLKKPAFSILSSEDFDLKNIFTFTNSFFIISLFLQLSFWQFTQFSLIVNIIAIVSLYFFNQINTYKLLDYFILILITWFVTICYLLGSPLILNSLFFFITLSFLISIYLLTHRIKVLKNYGLRFIYLLIPFVVGTGIHKLIAYFNKQGSDNHVFKFITQRFKETNDFHAELYLCDDAFNKMSSFLINQLFNNGYFWLLISTGLMLILLFAKKNFRKDCNQILFLTLISIGFMIIAYMSQRFSTIGLPISIVLIATSIHLFSNNFKFYKQKKHLQKALPIGLSCIFLFLNWSSIDSLWSQKRPSPGNTLPQLIQFINVNTHQDDIFAASMPLTSSIRLLSRRPIFIHPQYENAELRKRVKEVYKIYGNFKEQNLNTYFNNFNIKYIVTEGSYCYFRSATGCQMKDLINEGTYNDETQFCTRKFNDSKYFKKVFDNRRFQVLEVLKP